MCSWLAPKASRTVRLGVRNDANAPVASNETKQFTMSRLRTLSEE